MKHKKGFTLVELLAVIVILALILAVAVPSISGIISNSHIQAYNLNEKMLKKAAKTYIDSSNPGGALSEGESLLITLDELIEQQFLNEIKDPKDKTSTCGGYVKISSESNNYTYSPYLKCGDNYVSDGYTPYPSPELFVGMIPIRYNGSHWEKASSINVMNNWYNYDNQVWANAVLVTPASRDSYINASVGTQVNEGDIRAYYVWIPRYKYKIPDGSGPREISIVFEDIDTPKSNGDAVNDYYTHPAFSFGDQELSGIWVGKFETTGTSISPTVKPNLISLRSQNVISQNTTAELFASTTYITTPSEIDAHMMKNMEWGAVAYLYHSKYGKYGNGNYLSANREIYRNDSKGHYTGRTIGSTSTGSGGVQDYLTYGTYSYDGRACSTSSCSTEPITNTIAGYGGSTTGTIYGIYDMNGGASEQVMGVLLNEGNDSIQYANSGFTTVTLPFVATGDKYVDYFNYTTSDGDEDIGKKGDATLEICEWNEWYDDDCLMIKNGSPWLTRGGSYRYYAYTDCGGTCGSYYDKSQNVRSGIFNSYYSYTDGSGDNSLTFRSVIVASE